MNRILFISSYDPTKLSFDGVCKKLKLEIETFKKLNKEVDYIEFNGDSIYLNFYNDERIFLCKKGRNIYETYSIIYKNLLKINLSVYYVIYFRYEHIGLNFFKFLKKFKKITLNKGVVVGELPTFVKYNFKKDNFKIFIKWFIKEKISLIFSNLIDYIVTFSDHKKIYNIETIRIDNFADVENLTLKDNVKKANELHLLALAQLSPAHGFDRVIKGLYNYYKKENNVKVYLHIVGDGGEYTNVLKNLTKNMSLNTYVKFHGKLGGIELDNIFNLCNIGIGAIAVFRKGSDKVSELKIREYTSRGLPFIYNAKEILLKDKKFCKYVPFNESDINIDDLVVFSKSIDNKTSNDMRNFALKYFRADLQIKKIFDIVDRNK